MAKVSYSAKKGLVQESGTGVNIGGNVFQGAPSKVFTHTASSSNLTLTPSDSGAFITVAGNASGVKILLPIASETPGFHCTIMLTANPANDLDVEETTATNNFITMNIVGGANTDGLTGNQTLRFDRSLPNAAGDIANIYSDGVNYIVDSQSTGASAILAV